MLLYAKLQIIKISGGNLTVLVMDCNRWTMSGKKKWICGQKKWTRREVLLCD